MTSTPTRPRHSTKTLAKLGNAAAKKNPLFDSVADLRDEAVRTWVLDRFAVGDVWGVGGATAAKLADLKAMRKALTALLRQCDAGATKGNCPIIHALAAD